MMSRRSRQRNRAEIVKVGAAAGDLPFGIGRISVMIAGALIVVSVMIGAIRKGSAPSDSVPLAFASDDSDESINDFSAPQLPMTLEELLIEMRNRLRGENIRSKVRLEQATLRVMTEGPMYPLSKADISMGKNREVDAVADTLAWAVNCHISFTGTLSTNEGQEALRSCGLQSALPFDCIPGKGRVSLAGIRFEGHADAIPFRKLSAGESAEREFSSNQELSDARAERFAREIVQCAQTRLGSLGSKVTIPHETRGYSDSSPGESSDVDPKNRRVEIHFDEYGSGETKIR